MDARLQCNNLTIRVGERVLVRNLSLDISAGTLVFVLGTNGVGKTLTLHALAGLRQPGEGNIQICNDAIANLPRKKIAQRLGLLLQIQEDGFPLTVMERSLMGRHPQLGLWQWAGDEDRERVLQALKVFDLEGLENRIVTTLSGGERERLALATLFVQDPAIWLLDEPMNHLDPHHQLDVLAAFRETAGRGRVVVSTVHSPALAMRHADQVLMLYGQGDWEYGSAEELLEPNRLERMYQTRFRYFTSTDADSENPQTVLLPA